MGLKIKQLPATIFVKIEKEDDADWLNAARHAEAHAEIGTKTRVGIYKLVGVRDIEGVVESISVARKSR